MNDIESYDEIEFVRLEKGRVMLGNDRGSILHTAEQPRHEVLISHDVWVSRNCITKGQWNAHVPQELCYPSSDDMQEIAEVDYLDPTTFEARKRESIRRVEDDYSERSLWYVVGTSLLFEGLILTLAAWYVCKKDF